MKANSFITGGILFCILLFTFLTADAQHHRYYNSYGYRPYYSQRAVYRNYPRVVVPYGGISYHYYNGFFYRPYGPGLQIVAPPFGIRVGFLPRGYFPIHINAGLFFYNQGVFYRPYQDYYEVVAPPVGAEVPELPGGAKAVVIDGDKYYEMQGTYYKETIRSNGEIWYTVMGKNGVLNTETNPGSTNNTSGIISILPEGSHAITLNGQKYFVAPDGTYYQEMTDSQNGTYYKIVGKSSVN